MIFNLIIPLYNSNYIQIQLKSIFDLILDSKIKLNVIYVDDGSEMEFTGLYKNNILNFSKINIDIHYISLGPKNGQNRVCMARNLGAKKAIGENLIFIDQDTILHKNYLNYLINIIKYSDNLDILIGPYFGYNNLPKKLEKENINFFIEYGYINKNNFKDFRIPFFQKKLKQKRIWEFFLASNMFIKKYIFEKNGGFDEKIITWGDEDVELGYRLYKEGYNISFYENFVVLNLSEKLYEKPYNILKDDKIKYLSNNWLYNFEKHNKDFEYRRYILDRFDNFSYENKLKTTKVFQSQLIFHNYYNKNQNKIIFFRLDDVKELTINLKMVLNLFIKYNIPIILSVEPANVDIQTINYLINLKEKHPDLFDIVQHGYNHINNSKGYYKYEFGDGIDINKQLINLEKGYNLMKNFFGNNFFEAFVPPFNKFTFSLSNKLNDLGFNVFSAGYPFKYIMNDNIICLPFFLDIISNYMVDIKYKDIKMIVYEYNNCIQRDGYAGFFLHPQYLTEESFKLIIKLLELLKSKKDIDFLNFNSFLTKYSINEINNT